MMAGSRRSTKPLPAQVLSSRRSWCRPKRVKVNWEDVRTESTEMYVQDPRFTATYEAIEPGLTVRVAMPSGPTPAALDRGQRKLAGEERDYLPRGSGTLGAPIGPAETRGIHRGGAPGSVDAWPPGAPASAGRGVPLRWDQRHPSIKFQHRAELEFRLA